MNRPNLWVVGGAFFLVVGFVTTMVGILGGGLVSSAGVLGALMPSVLSFVFGVVLIRIGSRPGRFDRR